VLGCDIAVRSASPLQVGRLAERLALHLQLGMQGVQEEVATSWACMRQQEYSNLEASPSLALGQQAPLLLAQVSTQPGLKTQMTKSHPLPPHLVLGPSTLGASWTAVMIEMTESAIFTIVAAALGEKAATAAFSGEVAD